MGLNRFFVWNDKFMVFRAGIVFGISSKLYDFSRKKENLFMCLYKIFLWAKQVIKLNILAEIKAG